jgi:hypothetical protein
MHWVVRRMREREVIGRKAERKEQRAGKDVSVWLIVAQLGRSRIKLTERCVKSLFIYSLIQALREVQGLEVSETNVRIFLLIVWNMRNL